MLHDAPYMNNRSSVSIVMLKVMIALLPGIAVYVYLYGIGIGIQLILATITAWITEYVMLKIRAYQARPFLLDGSVTVTAWLLALSFPPLAPWWMIVLATAFAVIVAKHLYGGLGHNLFNPAMVGFAVMMIAYPQEMSRYITPSMADLLDVKDTLHYIFLGIMPKHLSLDAMVSATPLDQMKTALLAKAILHDGAVPLFVLKGAAGMEWVAIAYLLGGLFLLQQRLIPWQIPLGVIMGVSVLAIPLHFYAPMKYASIFVHLLSGGTLLCAFFIATDPVTAPATVWGRGIFAFAVGALTYVIRVFGGFPDGIAFAVLMMNMAVPLIDQYTRPAVFGHKKSRTL